MEVRRRMVWIGVAFALIGCDEVGNTQGSPSRPQANSSTCGATALQDLVGTGIDKLDSASLPPNKRFILSGSTTSGVTVPDRLSVEVGRDGRVVRVFCG